MPTRPCKPGKTPTGKNGRCVKITTKICKPGKTPTGKNGRCVNSNTSAKSKTIKVNKSKTPAIIDVKIVVYGDGKLLDLEKGVLDWEDILEIFNIVSTKLDVPDRNIDYLTCPYYFVSVKYNKATKRIGNGNSEFDKKYDISKAIDYGGFKKIELEFQQLPKDHIKNEFKNGALAGWLA